jgi:hypothetical protein
MQSIRRGLYSMALPAIGDYHSHEHYFANRNRIGNRFQHAQDAQD